MLCRKKRKVQGKSEPGQMLATPIFKTSETFEKAKYQNSFLFLKVLTISFGSALYIFFSEHLLFSVGFHNLSQTDVAPYGHGWNWDGYIQGWLSKEHFAMLKSSSY